MKHYIEREITSFEGSQIFQTEANSIKEAVELFKSGKCEIIDTEIEVLGLEAWDEVDFSLIYIEQK